MATETQVPGSQTTQTLTLSSVSLQAGSEGGQVVNTQYVFQLQSNNEIIELKIGSTGTTPLPTTGQIWPSKL